MLSGVKPTNPPAANPAAVIEVNEANFEREVVARSREVPVVIDFWAPWCGPCRTLGPALERLAAEAKGAWILAKVNVDENPRLSQTFRIQSIPAVMAVHEGKVVEQFVGALPESQLRAWLKRFVPEPADDLVEAAQSFEVSNPDEAAARYRLILGQEPENVAAMFNLGRLLVMRGEAEGTATLRQVPAGTPFFTRAQAMLTAADFFAPAAQNGAETESAARYHQAALSAQHGDYASALDDLLAIVMRDRAFYDDGARKAILAIFAALGDENSLVPAYRRKLANVLF